MSDRPTVLVALVSDAEPLGLLEAPLREAGLTIERWYPAAQPPPDGLGGYAAVIAMGGETNPDQDDRFPWLGAERALLADAVRRELPVLGVCLGAELLAQAAGGRSDRLAAPAIGWVEVERAPEAAADPLLGALPERFCTFEWHGFGFTPPPGGVLLAAGDGRPQAFRHGERAWGVQFHPEVDAGIVGGWASGAPGALRAAGVDPERLLAESERHTPAHRRLAGALGRAFAGVVLSASRAPRRASRASSTPGRAP
jgi:GMP synthase (glutamine-hydrolysing)